VSSFPRRTLITIQILNLRRHQAYEHPSTTFKSITAIINKTKGAPAHEHPPPHRKDFARAAITGAGAGLCPERACGSPGECLMIPAAYDCHDAGQAVEQQGRAQVVRGRAAVD